MTNLKMLTILSHQSCSLCIWILMITIPKPVFDVSKKYHDDSFHQILPKDDWITVAVCQFLYQLLTVFTVQMVPKVERRREEYKA